MTPVEACAGGDHRQYLDSLVLHGIKLGLQNITHLMEASGRPHRSYPVVHVAGTNGKGSVLTFLAAILGAAGYRVGCYTSPHLLRFNERARILGDAIAAVIADYNDAAEQMRRIIAAADREKGVV